MIVDKPQFDTDTVKPSMFVMFCEKLSPSSNIYSNWYKGFIISVEPFKFAVQCYSSIESNCVVKK